MKKPLELIYIGDHFYRDSGTIMSSLYDTDGVRQDWGKVQLACRTGQRVNIRPANKEELAYYLKELYALKKRREEA